MDPSVDRRRRHDVDQLDLQPAAAEGARGGLRGAERDAVPRPRHQPGVRLERGRSGVRRLPGRSLEHRRDPRRHAGPGRGHLRGVTPDRARRRRSGGRAFTLAAKRGQHWQRQSRPRSRTRPHPVAEREDRAGSGSSMDATAGSCWRWSGSRRSCTSGWSGSRRSPRSCSRSRTGRGSGSATSTGSASRTTSRSSPSSSGTSSRR